MSWCKEKSFNLFQSRSPIFPPSEERMREGEACGSLRFFWGPPLASLFQWLDWHREVHASESVCALMDIGKWFQGGFLVLFPFNGFLCGSYPFTLASTTWAEKKREDSRNPFGRSPPGPWQVALCSLGWKKSTGWGSSDHGSQGEEEGYW